MAIKPEIILNLVIGQRAVRIAKDSPYRLLAGGLSGIESAGYRITLGENALTDGGYITREAFEPREISISFCVDDKENTEAHRQMLLRYLNPKQKVTLHITRSGVTRKIEGQIDGEIIFEQPNIMQDRLKVSLNLLCPDPWFYDEQPFALEFKKVAPLLTFPFNSLEGVGIMSGLVWRTGEMDITNPGDDAMGIQAEIMARGEIVNPRLSLDDGQYVRLLTVMKAGDRAEISTIPKQKDIKINGKSSFLYDRKSAFFSIPPGKHTLTILADSGAENAATEVLCYVKYLGV